MGAETRCFVKVQKIYHEWIEFNTISLADAEREAKDLPDVIGIVSSQYEDPEDEKNIQNLDFTYL